MGAEVPDVEGRRLRELRAAGDWDGLNLACAVLARRGYSLAAIGRAAGVGREVIRRRVGRVPAAWVARVRRDPATRPVKPAANPFGRGKRKAQRVPARDAARLAELWPVAKGRRGAHLPGSPPRDASDAMDRICGRLYWERGVASAAIAAAFGGTPRAVEKRAHRWRDEQQAKVSA